MKSVRFILYVLAALAYAVMPINGMALEVVEHRPSVMMSIEPVSPAGQDHGDCAGQHESGKHRGAACGHCAACLTLPAQLFVLDMQALLRTAPMPGLGTMLLSQNNMPLVPPPRS